MVLQIGGRGLQVPSPMGAQNFLAFTTKEPPRGDRACRRGTRPDRSVCARIDRTRFKDHGVPRVGCYSRRLLCEPRRAARAGVPSAFSEPTGGLGLYDLGCGTMRM